MAINCRRRSCPQPLGPERQRRMGKGGLFCLRARSRFSGEEKSPNPHCGKKDRGLQTGLLQDQPLFEACVRCGLERKKLNGRRQGDVSSGPRRRRNKSLLPSGLALQSSFKARRIREATGGGGIASGDDGAAMRSVLNEGDCRGGAPFSGEVRRRPGWRYRATSRSRGTARGADNIIGPSGGTLHRRAAPEIPGRPSVIHCETSRSGRRLALWRRIAPGLLL